jgi:hypothetical protein
MLSYSGVGAMEQKVVLNRVGHCLAYQVALTH